MARLLLLLPLLVSPVLGQGPDNLLGAYRHEPVTNDWHEGQIRYQQVAGRQQLVWENKAGRRWTLTPDAAFERLRTGPRNPYHKLGHHDFVLEVRAGRVVGFTFGDQQYTRAGETRIVQRSNGFHGYISMRVPKPPPGHGHGASFYAAIWPLLRRPLAGFQIGLPATWIIPENRDFKQNLVPPWVPAYAWKERAPTYHDVFQTIEGGLGYWGSTQFGSVVPKYRMNGTPNGYLHEISSPGWGFGKIEPLAPEQLGLAQLSNRLLVPPDGLTFGELGESGGQLLGNAWMALPLVPARAGPEVPTGEQCWTLFLRAANFQGGVAFWIPDIWSRMSRRHRTIVGRGLDARPGLMGSGAMEVNTVPCFEYEDAAGAVWSKIPELLFPTDSQGRSVLMQDILLYRAEALAEPLRKARAAGTALPRAADPEAAWRPDCVPRPLRFHQGHGKARDPLVGYEPYLQTVTFGEKRRNGFGLQWTAARGQASLPQYFRKAGRAPGPRQVVPASEVPAQLREKQFLAHVRRGPYAPDPAQMPGAAASRPAQVRLRDGSTLTYVWYRFVDQPSIQAQNWPPPVLTRLQALVERIHREWDGLGIMPPPSSGQLVELDPAQLLRPPAGLEHGYVPVAIRQSR